MPEIQTALRTGISEVTKHTPQFLVFGSELVLDGRAHEYDGDVAEVADGARDAHAVAHQSRKTLFDEIASRMKRACARNQKYWNARRRVVEFSEGAQVLRKHFTLSDAAQGYSAKLAPRWIGPFTVTKREGEVSYRLSDAQGRDDGVWHVEQLKRFLPRACGDASY